MRTIHSSREARARRLPARLRVVCVVVACVAALVGVTSAAPGAEPAGGVDPANVELTLGPGQSATVAKHVTTPAVAPRPDIVILGDTTGSMDPVVANVRNNIDTIINRVRESQPTARFAIAGYKEIVNGDKVFTVYTPLTDEAAAVRGGLGTMSHDVFGGGAPWTDFINAHFRIGTDALAFRPGGSRIVLWFGDASSHDPSLGHTVADANNALSALGARVIAVPVVGTSGDGLDRLGQASSIVNATRGRLMSNSGADQVADALLAGLQNLDVTVTPHINSCDTALTVGFDAASRTVRSGTVADFGETVRVRPDAAAGTYRCSIEFLINGISSGLVQNTTVHVPGLSVGNVTVTEGDAGTAMAVFPVTLDRAATTPVTVHVATADGTARQPGDYLQTTKDVRFELGQLSQQVEVPIVGDTVREDLETFTVNLSAPSGAAITTGSGIGTINDNDGIVPTRVSIGDVRVVEGNAGTTQAVFTVSLDRVSTLDVSVRAATANASATVADGDYTAVNQVITIPAGQTSRTVSVPVVGDTRPEADETFVVNLSAPTNVSIADGQGVGTILNDDQLRPVLSIDDLSVIEGNSGQTQATFTISLDRAPTVGDVAVHWGTTDGTATLTDQDYVQASGDETFTAGQTNKRITVNVNGDTRSEPDESYFVVLSGVTNADVRDDRGEGVIRNDDEAPRPIARIDDVRVTEGDSETTTATFTISLDRAPGATPVELDWATIDGTATVRDNDYAAGGRRETFTGSETSRQVTVLVNGDTKFEPDETFTVHLSNITGGTIADADGSGLIVNDDPVPPGLRISDVSVAEGNAGTTRATFTVTLDRPAPTPVRVHVATRDDTADGTDYVPVARDLTFSGDVVSQTFGVDVIGDSAFEPNEQFFVELSNPENAQILDGQGIGIIANDDPNIKPKVSISDVSLLEGNSGTKLATFTIRLDRAPTLEVRVPWATGDGTATVENRDYNRASGVETFAAGETSKVVTVEIVGDTAVEPNETFEVRLGEVTNADVADEQGVGTILNDDSPPDLQLSIGDTSVVEGNAGSTVATFAITLNQAPTAGTVTVRWATHDGSATLADNDYQQASGQVVFETGQASKTVQVLVNGDNKIEPDEQFTVELSEPTGGARIVRSPGTGTIVNDDGGTPPPAPRLSIGDTSLFEGNAGQIPATVTVTLANGPTDRDLSVDYATHDGTAVAPGDYTSASGHLTFSPGEVSKTIQVPVIGDTAMEEDETFTVALTNQSAGVDLGTGTGTGTIRNDDNGTPPSRSQLSIGDTRIVEGNDGVTKAIFTVSLNRAAGFTDPIGVDYQTANGSATVEDHDYTAKSGQLDFTGAKTSDQVVVDILGDGRVEPAEAFAVLLSNATGADIVAPGRGTGTILNDDQTVLPRASIGDVSVTEGNNGRTVATFTVTLDRMPTAPASLHFATANGTATAPGDYIATSGDLRFTGTSQTVSVEVVGDLLGEPNETFLVELSAATGLTIVDGAGIGTIINDDPVRTGVFTCTATALNKTNSTANPPNQPCRDDARSADLVNVNLGVISIKGSGLIATTSQTPDDLNTPPAEGDNATAHAELASIKIRVLAATIEVGVITSTATVQCVPGSDGLVPEFLGSSTVTALKVNGIAIPIGSGPIHVPLLIGSLDLNVTHRTANSITQTAFTLNTLLGKVVIGEASAGMHAIPGNPVTPNRNACR